MATNYLYLYDDDGDYPCQLLGEDATLPPEDREAYIEIGIGHEPIRARVWMTSEAFQNLPVNLQRGSGKCGIKLGAPANAFDGPTVNGTVMTELKYAKNFRLVSARVARAGTDVAMLELLLATEQNWWIYRPTNNIFNILSDDKKSFMAGAASSSLAFTYDQVRGVLEDDLGLTITGSFPFTPVARPFNLRFQRTPAGEALARILRPLGVQLVADPFTSATDITYTYVRFDYTDTADDTRLTALANFNAYTASGWYKDFLAFNVAPLSVDVIFLKWPPTESSGPTDSTVEAYTAFNELNPITVFGITGTKSTIAVGDHYDVSGKTYTESLSNIATERADCYYKRTNIPDEVWGFIGPYKFLPSATIRRVRVSIDLDGCFTMVYRHGKVDQPREGWQPIWSTWHTPSRFPEFNVGIYQGGVPWDDGTFGIFNALTEDCSTSASS